MNPLKLLWPGGRWRWVWRGMVFFVLFSVISVEITSRSSFCNSCHIMNTYYDSWARGPHKMVDCVKCHIPPGPTSLIHAKLNGLGQVVDDTLGRTNAKASAIVPDESCLRSGCHDIERVKKQARKDGKFFFDHGKHVGKEFSELKIKCTTCHSHVNGQNHFEINTNACVTCHLAYPKLAKVKLASNDTATSTEAKPEDGPKLPPTNCDSCHRAPEKPIEYQGLRVVHAEYLAYGASCDSCHRNITAPVAPITDTTCYNCHDFGIEKMKSVGEMHKIHTAGHKKTMCLSCHGVIKHGPVAQSMTFQQFDCNMCHAGQHSIQQTTYKQRGPATAPTTSTVVSSTLPGVAPHTTDAQAVTPMFMAHVNCNGCHITPKALREKPDSGATVKTASSASCDQCHKPGLGATMIPMWQKNTHELYDAVITLKPAEEMKNPEAKQMAIDAIKLVDLVRLDGSWGVHNPKYTQELLEKARVQLTQAKKLENGGGK